MVHSFYFWEGWIYLTLSNVKFWMMIFQWIVWGKSLFSCIVFHITVQWSSKNYDSVPHSQGLLNKVSEHFCRTMLHISKSRADNSGERYQSLEALWQNSKLTHCVSHVHWESMRHDCRFYLKFMTIMIKSMVIDFLYFLLYNCIFLNYCSR